MDLENNILKFALENAVKFKGRANPGSIIPKMIGLDPSLKSNMKELGGTIAKIVGEVNALSLEEQTKKLLEINPNYFNNQQSAKKERQEQRKELPELKNAIMGKVCTRIPPEPSKYNHLGHAISFLLNYMYAIKYEGKCIMRFDDTNPEKEEQEYVDAMQEDVLEYLDIKPSSTVFASDHMQDFIDKAEQLIKEGHAYTGNQPSKDISIYRREMKDHPDRNKSTEQVMSEWKSMKEADEKFLDYTLRLKISMQHKNAVMRDPVIFRVVNSTHYRQNDKYHLWPMYDFECAIMEGKLETTHVLRSNEFDSRVELQDHIRNYFGLPNPVVKQYARFNVVGATTKGREIRELIETGDYIGWDDPRLITLRALKRRGIVKEAYYELAKVIGMSKTTSDLDFSVIAAINRQLLDESAKRFFFIKDPVEVTIENAPDQEVELSIHPHHSKGGRPFKTNDKFILSKEDLNKIEDKELFRLMDCLNATKEGDKITFHSTDVDTFKKSGKKIIHWLVNDESQLANTEILMPDCTSLKAKAEKNIQLLKPGDIVQFERFGFCRLDSVKNDTYKFWFAHN